MRARSLATVATALTTLLVLASMALAAVVADDEDTPRPNTEVLQPNLLAVKEVTAELEAEVELLRATRHRGRLAGILGDLEARIEFLKKSAAPGGFSGAGDRPLRLGRPGARVSRLRRR